MFTYILESFGLNMTKTRAQTAAEQNQDGLGSETSQVSGTPKKTRAHSRGRRTVLDDPTPIRPPSRARPPIAPTAPMANSSYVEIDPNEESDAFDEHYQDAVRTLRYRDPVRPLRYRAMKFEEDDDEVPEPPKQKKKDPVIGSKLFLGFELRLILILFLLIFSFSTYLAYRSHSEYVKSMEATLEANKKAIETYQGQIQKFIKSSRD